MCLCTCLHVWKPHVCRYPQRPAKGVKSLGARVKSGCELPNRGAGNLVSSGRTTWDCDLWAILPFLKVNLKKRNQFWNCESLTKKLQERYKRSDPSSPRFTICNICHIFPSFPLHNKHTSFYFFHSNLYIHSFTYKFLLLHWPVCSMMPIQHLGL